MHHIEANIYFLTTAQGGRSTPAANGYRPQFYYNHEDFDASHTYPAVPRVNPGDTVTAHLTFGTPELQIQKLYVGMPFLIREGARTIAKGTITAICDPALARPTI